MAFSIPLMWRAIPGVSNGFKKDIGDWKSLSIKVHIWSGRIPLHSGFATRKQVDAKSSLRMMADDLG